MAAPEVMITAEEFAKTKGFSVQNVIGMVRDGFYEGRIVGDQ